MEVSIRMLTKRYGSIEEYILYQAKKLHDRGAIGNYYGFAISFPIHKPLSLKTKVKLFQNKWHPTYIYVYVDNDSAKIANDYLCHFCYGLGDIEHAIKFKQQFLDFIDWICQFFVESSPSEGVNEDVNLFFNDNDKIKHKVLEMVGLSKEFNDVFVDTGSAYHNFDFNKGTETLSKLKNIILNYCKYRKLYEANII